MFRRAIAMAIVAFTISVAACSSAITTPAASSTATIEPAPTHRPGEAPTPTVRPTSAPALASATAGLLGTATPTSSQNAPPEAIPVPPDRDLYELARRLVLQTDQSVSRFASPVPVQLHEGSKVEWRVSRESGNETVTATVEHVSENAYWIFEDGYDPDDGRLAQAARDFEDEVWPAVIGTLGSVWSPGVDGDPRIVVFHGELRPGVAGYFSGADEYPVNIQPESNQRETIYISVNLLTLGGDGYMATLAHELQHAVHWAADAGEESWVNEGLSEIASGLSGIPIDSISAFLRKPNTSLIQWEPEIFEASPNYGGAALYFEYLASHYGGNAALRAIVENQADGLASVDAVLSEMGHGQSATDVFRDWVVANLVDDDAGVYSHPARNIGPVRTTSLHTGETVSGSVRPFGTNYYRVEQPGDTLRVELLGVPTGQVFPELPRTGQACWWSNAGDSIDATLTRSVDLQAIEAATFTFWTWYAIEEDWDYAYVEVSTDGGSTWQILPSRLSSHTNPNGTAFGPGLTGITNGWVQDEVSLSRYAGSQILLRLEYITDDAIHDRGACFDDFQIAEIGWTDSGDDAGDWISEGFALINDRRPVEYLVQVIYTSDSGQSRVERLSNAPDGSIMTDLPGPQVDETVYIAVSVITPEVAGSLEYSLRITE